ncbi:MAG: accessory gene regulator B family protein [Clostridia bacterium]|nr:accessory gene regulator B family protein [Clostridia bacterium]
MLEEIGEMVSDTVVENVESSSPNQKEIVKYTVEQLVGEFLKIILMAAIAIYFKIGTLLLIAIFSMAIYRIPSGGVHFKGHVSCFVASCLIFFGNVFISMNLRGAYLDCLYFFIFLFNIPIIYYFAPADTEMKPIVSKKLRRNLRIISYVCMIATILIGRFVITDLTIRNIFIIGTLFQSLTMLPFAYKIAGTKYGFRDGIYEPQI